MKQAFLALVVAACVAVTLIAADLTGAWTLELNPDFGGEQDSLECKFTQSGSQLSADCGGGPPILGRVDGRTMTLQVKTGRNGEFTGILEGELDQAETMISGTWRLTDDTGARDGKFVARKH